MKGVRLVDAGDVTVSAAGSEPTRLMSFTHPKGIHHRPIFLPDGRRFLYFAEPDEVYVGSLDGGSSARVPISTEAAVYAPPGDLVYRQGSALVAQRFDSSLSRPLGVPVAVAGDVVRAVADLDGRARFRAGAATDKNSSILPPAAP